MVNVTIYFHHGGDWVKHPETLYEKGRIHYWKGYDPDLLFFTDLVNEYTSKLCFLSVQQLIVLGPSGKYFEIQGDEGIRTLLSFISEDFHSIHLFATDDCELPVDVLDIVLHSSSFLPVPIVDEAGTDCSDNEMVFSYSEYDTDELEDLFTKKRRTITDSLQDYKEIAKGMAFKDIPEARQFCKFYALSKKVELVVVKSDRKRISYTCGAEGCPFQLLISGDDTTPGVSVKTLIDHIEPHLVAYDNNAIDYTTIAHYFKKKIQSDPKYKVKEMKADLHKVFDLNVSETKCKRAKREILESLQGSFTDCYKKLEAYATELRSCNPGSDVVIQLSKEALENGRRKFLRMYICFKALKMGFKAGLRPLIGLDGTFLKGKARGQLLVAVGQDNMNCFYPIAWAVVDKETKRTWTWFMQHLQHSLELQNGEGITFISDMQKGLVDAVKNVLPKAYHRFCVRHIEANWCRRWGKGELKKLLWWAAWSSFSEEFKHQLKEIKQVDEEAGQDLLDRYPPKIWCRAYLDTVCKNQVVDNNFIESFNGWILKARYMPIIGMLEEIRVKVMTRLAEKEAFVMKWIDDGFSPKSELLYNEFLKISQVCRMSGNGDNGYEVTEGEDRHIVNLKEKRCTCRTWDLTGIPCPHAIKAMEHKKIKPKTEISKFYSKETALQVYKYKLQPVRGELFWKVDPSQAMEPPEMIKLIGRPKTQRDRQKDEELKRQGEWKQSRKGKVMTCSTCGLRNHNSRGCGKHSKQAAAKQKQPAGGRKRQHPRNGLIDEEEPDEENINLTSPHPTQENQHVLDSVYPYCSSMPDFEEDDEDPLLMVRTESEEAYLQRLQRRQRPQQPTGVEL